MRAVILLVNGERKALRQIEAVLTAQAYLVAAASSSRRAGQLLNSVIPDLMIAAARLRAFAVEGVQLATLGRAEHPNLPVIITHGSPDADLEQEASSRGMIFIANPLTNPDFLPCVKAALGHRPPAYAVVRRWPRKRVSDVPVQVDAAPAQIVDVSYQGLKVELRDPGDSDATVFDVSLPEAGVTVKTERVWRSRAPEADDYWWGMKLLEVDPAMLERWREFVDSIGDPTRRSD
jgi:DNA-binding response OmpR family regulator